MNQSRFTSRISFKLAWVTVILALLVGLLMTGIQVIRDYNEATDSLEEIVYGSLNAVDKAATRAVLLIDPPLAREVVSGLFEYDYISSAQIVDESGSQLAAVSRQLDHELGSEVMSDYLVGDATTYTLDLELPEQITGQTGKLIVTVDRAVGLAPFFDRAVATLLSSLVHSVALAILLYVAFHRGITRPLTGLVDVVSSINPDQPGEKRITIAKAHENDELGILASQINQSFDAVQVLLDNLRSTNRALSSSEEALRRRSWELEQEIERTKITSRELVATKEQAEAANRAKSVFLANVSHELRTPLNAIIGFSSIMSEELFGPIGHERYQNYLEDIRSSSEHLSEVLGEVLDLAKIEAGQIKLEESELDLWLLCQQCLSLVSGQAANKNLYVKLVDKAELPHLNGDRLRIKQAVLNLLSNAIKFSPASGEPVEVRAFKRDDGGLSITVADKGVGIAPDEQELVFSPFIRSSSALSRSHEGTGLGLALVKSFVEEHEGTVTLESALGKGSAFTLNFPASRVLKDNSGAVQPSMTA